MTSIHFTDEMNSRNAAEVAEVLRAPRLWIPTHEDYGTNHDRWLERTEADLGKDKKHALLARYGLKAVGVVVFRPSPCIKTTLDIRNISINPDVDGRKFGSFMLRNTEVIAQEIYPSLTVAQIDTKQTNTAMVAFLLSQGYEQVGVEELYEDGKPDLLFEKHLRGKTL